ncbi:DUF4328 domain-containing protein [Myxococcus sp. K15C18031901]|uniref:DUF4328 domain-containing protein n=1 Tax=Myxococcus dinghuensis TaxID=2906761 RepID=UPI0020A7A055|nr:DUF4328 domain-containing protein [Myxococcus dinghuensis]MCP3103255.1 DUF4328 domain-containing protein [Myxococcus dinghuensis]
MVVELAYLVVYVWVYSTLRALGYSKPEAFEVYGTCLLVVRLTGTVTLTCSIVGFLTWQFRVTRATTMLGGNPRSPLWAILSWFIPGPSLFTPYQWFRDVWRDLGGDVHRPRQIRAWWCATLLTLALGIGNVWVIGRDDLSEFGIKALRITYTAMLLMSTVLCVRVVTHLQRRLTQKQQEVHGDA